MSESAASSAPIPTDYVIFVDEVSPRLRGWAFDQANPTQPARLRFRIGGRVVWEGTCDGSRPDVKGAGYPTELVGFSFKPEAATAGGMLTIETLGGAPLVMMVGTEARYETLVPAAQCATKEPVRAELSHLAHADAPGTVRNAIGAAASPEPTPHAAAPSARQESAARQAQSPWCEPLDDGQEPEPRRSGRAAGRGFLFGLFRHRQVGTV